MKFQNPGLEIKNSIRIHNETMAVLKQTPTMIVLFGFIAVLDSLALMSLYLAPSKPFSFLLAPIIRTFWGDTFLHYPLNFVLLPKLFNHAHFIILTLFGMMITGIVIKQIQAAVEGKKISIFFAAQAVSKKYFALLAVWLGTAALWRFGFARLIAYLPSNMFVHFALAFLSGVIFQACFVFIFPALLIQQESVFKNLREGILFGVKNLKSVSLLIALPVFFLFASSLLKSFAPVFVKVYPELVLWILSAGILISMFADLWITLSTTIYFMKARSSSYATAN